MTPEPTTSAAPESWKLPSPGRAGMAFLIVTETAFFAIFVVAYLFYVGKSTSGPTPREVLDLPILASILLWSSTFTIVIAVRALRAGHGTRFKTWWLLTFLLGLSFLLLTAREWARLIGTERLYTLVGLHALHVTIGLSVIGLIFALALRGHVDAEQAERTEVFSWYWHFVDGVWVIVFLTVYVVGR
jgi:cytochrome c oxidase subunit 3/cytochrome o ubiquinol oxidase subunit 3